ncbi:MAG: hypothetical protein U1F55_09710 [Chitinivorax sp.]
MKIPRLSMITLGVADLQKATAFYAQVLGTEPNTSYGGVAFIELPGVWLSLCPLADLAKDIGPEIPAQRAGFGGITLSLTVSSFVYLLPIRMLSMSAGGCDGETGGI